MKKILEDAAREKPRRDRMSVATGISLERGSGARQRKCGYMGCGPQNYAARLPCNEERQAVGKNLQKDDGMSARDRGGAGAGREVTKERAR